MGDSRAVGDSRAAGVQGATDLGQASITENGSGSLTLCLPLDFHNPLQHSPLRLIFLSNFKIFLVIVCHCVV